MAARALLSRLRIELRTAADPLKAPQMQAYMKSEMPFHGVPALLLKSICRDLYAELDLADPGRWEREVVALWEGARYREERYAAIQLAEHRRARIHHTPKAMPLFERLIVEGAWWDHVDGVATHLVGAVLKDHPAKLKPQMRKWSVSPDMWKRRTSIICQLSHKAQTDLALLYDCIEPSIGSEEFFLRKAIGWALRQYAKTDPAEVARYVKRNESRLSGLSRREALKHASSS